jgi:hypothetical protein
LELRFSISSKGELMVEGQDLQTDQVIPPRRLGSVR